MPRAVAPSANLDGGPNIGIFMRKKTTSSGRGKRPPRRTSREIETTGLPTALAVSPPPRSEPRNHRELAQAIFAQCDPVQVGRELLSSSSEKGASVRARVFETLADWQFGAPARTGASSSGAAAVRIIWNIPGPPRESEEPQ